MTSLQFILAICLFQSAFCNFLVGTGSDRIYHVKLMGGTYQIIQTFPTGPIPSFILLSSDKKFLYAVNEGNQAIQSFQVVESRSGLSLNKINEINSTGDAPCYLHLTLDGRFIGVANYGTNFGVFAINQQDGSLHYKPIQFYPKREGHGTNPGRQESSHPHQIYIHPNQENVYVSDLGLDHIYFFKLKDGEMTEKQMTNVAPGTGPRHLIAHPTNPSVLYGSNELTGNINRYGMNQDGSLNLLESYPFHPTLKISSADTGAAILVSKAGFLYFSVRGLDLISVFRVSPDSTLVYINTYDCKGTTPRFMTLNPDESKLFVLHQNSRSLAIFGIDNENLNFEVLIKDIESPQSLVFL